MIPDAESIPTPRYTALLEQAGKEWWDAKNFEKWKRHYVDEYARGHWIVTFLSRHIKNFHAEDLAVVDVGCGDAGVPIAFAELGASPVVGIEPSAESLRRGRVRAEEHRIDVKLVGAVAERLPLEDARHDLVILDNVLEHVENRQRSLEEASRVLRAGGLLYAVTPKPFSLHALLSDPHYQIPGLVLLPPPIQRWLFERVISRGRREFGVGVIPTRWSATRMIRQAGFELIADPRKLWIEYLKQRVASPDHIRPPKRRLARWLDDHCSLLDNPVVRIALDYALGSNFFIARKMQ